MVVIVVIVVIVVMVVRERDSIPDEGGGGSPWMCRRAAAFKNFVQHDVNYHTVAVLRLVLVKIGHNRNDKAIRR